MDKNLAEKAKHLVQIVQPVQKPEKIKIPKEFIDKSVDDLPVLEV